MEFNMFIVSKFILTVSHNDNPIIDFLYRLNICKKTWIIFWIKMLTWENEQDNYLCLLQQYKWNNQNMTDTINHPCAMCIKFHDYSWLFHQSIKKLAIVEGLFWQLGTCFSGHCHCREVAVVKKFKGAVSRNSAKLRNYKMPVKLRET